MIYLLHGDDTVTSRAYLLKLKEGYESVETLEVKTFFKNPEVFLTAQELFATKKLLIIEDFVKDAPELTASEGTDLVFWTDDEIAYPPKWVTKTLVFKIPDQALTFKFVDALTEGNEKQAFTVFEKLVRENTPSELIIGSLTRQLRLLALGLEGSWDKVSKSSFVQNKIRSQMANWERKKIRSAALLVLKTDWDIKSGSLKPEQAWTQLISNFLKLAN